METERTSPPVDRSGSAPAPGQRGPALTPARFRRCAEAYGADMQRWPPADRVAARVLMRQDPTVTAVLQAADGLDRLLDRSGGYRSRRLTPHRRTAGASVRLGTALTALCLLGFGVGLWGGGAGFGAWPLTTAETAALEAVAFGALAEWDLQL